MNLPGLSIRRPVATLMAVCIVLLLGVVSFTGLPLDLLPEFEFPTVAVITDYEGAAPQEVENMVTRPLEEVLATVQGVKNISSISQAGTSIVLLELTWGTSLDFALLDVREKIDLVKGYLPDDAGSPWVFKADPTMMPVIQLSLFGDKEEWELLHLAEDVVKPRLERIEGVASVSVTGGRAREIRVKADVELLNHYGISLEQLIRALAAENYSISAGIMQEGGKDYHLRAVGEFSSLEEMENLVLSAGPQGTVFLKDVAEVMDTYRDQRRIHRFNGKPSIGLDIYKQADANTVSVSRALWKALDNMEKTLPAGVYIYKVLDQADFIRESILSVVEVGILGAVLAIFILLLFLRNFRSTLVVSLSIPVSVVATFVLMYFTGLTLNIISLGGLALGLGIMVDSSIVVLENIYRFRQEGKGILEAALEGSRQVSGAITAATLTTVVVFLPVVFVGGFASQIFKAMALTVSFSLLASLLIALTVVPLLSSRLLVRVASYGGEVEGRGGKGEKEMGSFLYRLTGLFHRFYGKVEDFYREVLPWTLRHRKLVMGVFVGSFLLAFALVPFIGAEFLPEMDQGYISVQAELPRGTGLKETERVALAAEEIIKAIPEVESVHLSVGGGGTFGFSLGGSAGNVARLEVILKDIKQRERSAHELADVIRQELAGIVGAEFSISAGGVMGITGISGPPISIAVRGDDLEQLEILTASIAEIVRGIPGTREVKTSFEEGQPEISVFFDREKASKHGLSFSQVSNSLRAALSGQVATRYRTEGKELDVRVMLPEEQSSSISTLKLLTLSSPYGYRVPLLEVTAFQEGEAPMSINRHNQVRSATVDSELVGRSPSMVIRDIQRALADLSFPDGYSIDFEGEQQLMQESFEELTLALILAILLVYMIMAAQFESLLHPFIIMFTLPQTFTGVALALVLTGRTLNVASFIGVIMLAGIVVNNGIVLVDYINKLREMGRSWQEAILEAGPVRLRPILMTTLTTILGMFPLALGFGSGAELRAPLATAIIGGLLFSTLLTLIVIPVAYSLVEDLKALVAKKFLRLTRQF